MNNEQEQTENEKRENNDKANLSFEEALAKLEGHVRSLEQGELTLEQSLTIFEDGMKLANFCTKRLDEAEQKIEVLVEKNGKLLREDFELKEE